MTMVDYTLEVSNEAVSSDSDSIVVDPQEAIDSALVDEQLVSIHTKTQGTPVIDVNVECNDKTTSASRKLRWKLKPVEYLRERRNAIDLQKHCMDHPSLFTGKYKEIGPVKSDNAFVKGDVEIMSVDKCSETRSTTMTSEDKKNLVDAIVGKRIGKWTLLKLLGQGGFGRVYSSKTIVPSASGGLSATKVLTKTRCDLAKYRRRLEKANLEIGILRHHGHHPNIITFEGVVHTYSHIFIVMERATTDLHCLLSDRRSGFRRQHGGLKEVMTGVLMALTYLHDRGVAHLDVKETNILICQREGSPIRFSDIRLADFGLSRVSKNYNRRKGRLYNHFPLDMLLSTKLAVELTPSRRGTHTHMAPELPFKSCDGRIADMWSVGCMFLSLLVPRSYCKDWNASYACLLNPCDLQGFKETIKNSLDGLRIAWTPTGLLCGNGEQLHDLMFQELLVLDVTQRATASRALRHPWFQTS